MSSSVKAHETLGSISSLIGFAEATNISLQYTNLNILGAQTLTYSETHFSEHMLRHTSSNLRGCDILRSCLFCTKDIISSKHSTTSPSTASNWSDDMLHPPSVHRSNWRTFLHRASWIAKMPCKLAASDLRRSKNQPSNQTSFPLDRPYSRRGIHVLSV